MAAALPYCDALVSGHSLAALDEVVAAIGGPVGVGAVGRAGGATTSRARGRAVGERDPGARELGGDAERLRAEPGPDDAGMGDRGDERRRQPKICIYPGCERPAVPPHPLGGPQPAFCELEEHNALTAHQERQRLASRRADEPTTQEG